MKSLALKNCFCYHLWWDWQRVVFFFLTKVPVGLCFQGVVDSSFYTFFFLFLFIIVYFLYIQKLRNYKKFSSNFVLLRQSHLEWMPLFFFFKWNCTFHKMWHSIFWHVYNVVCNRRIMECFGTLCLNGLELGL